MKKLTTLISGKTYWYVNVVLSNTQKSLKINQKPVELTVIVKDGTISLYENNREVYHFGLWWRSYLSLDPESREYFANYLFETREDAAEGYNLLIDKVIDDVTDILEKRIELFKKKYIK